MTELSMDGLKDFVLAFIVIAFLGAAGVLGINGLMDSDSVGTLVTINEENVTVGASGIVTPAFIAYPYHLESVSRIVNSTGVKNSNTSIVIPTSLYNVTISEIGGGGTIKMTTNYTGFRVNISYSYKAFDKSMNISQQGKSGILNSTGFFGIIGTLMGVGLLIGVVALFTRRA